MKRASDATIQQRTANAQRKDVYWSNIILALIPVVNGFYYFQKMTIAAMAMADMKVCAQRS